MEAAPTTYSLLTGHFLPGYSPGAAPPLPFRTPALAADTVSTRALHLSSSPEFPPWIRHQAIRVFLLNHT